jgi:hypothetical protein
MAARDLQEQHWPRCAVGCELVRVALEAGDSVIATLRHPSALHDLANSYPTDSTRNRSM